MDCPTDIGLWRFERREVDFGIVVHAVTGYGDMTFGFELYSWEENTGLERWPQEVVEKALRLLAWS